MLPDLDIGFAERINVYLSRALQRMTRQVFVKNQPNE